MKLNKAKLNKLRAGNTVWRVLVQYSSFTKRITISANQILLQGKRVKHIFESGWSANRLIPKPGYGGWFLNDLQGDGCFDSYRQAQRFKQEVLDGKHPRLIQRAIDSATEMEAFDDLYPF